MPIKYLERSDEPRLAYRKLEASAEGVNLPVIVFCCGFRSDMEGTKAQFLENKCRDRGQGYLRFDYRGHGASDGAFNDGTIGRWKDDALAIIDHITTGSVILVGSSLGGWIALLVALERQDRIKGLVGIAAAPDFTREIYHDQFDDKARVLMEKQGYVDVPSEYSDEPYRITKELIDDGERHCLLDSDISLTIPVRLLQGTDDTDVPWKKAYRIKNAVPDEGLVEVLLIENGDHRLSRLEDLELLDQQIQDLSS